MSAGSGEPHARSASRKYSDPIRGDAHRSAPRHKLIVPPSLSRITWFRLAGELAGAVVAGYYALERVGQASQAEDPDSVLRVCHTSRVSLKVPIDGSNSRDDTEKVGSR
jgi:hypothetical protein